LGRHLETPPPPHSREFFFLPHSPLLLDIWVVFLVQNVPLGAALLFDLHAAIRVGYMLLFSPKKQLPRTVSLVDSLSSFYCISYIFIVRVLLPLPYKNKHCLGQLL
jgi:hypothetical protein